MSGLRVFQKQKPDYCWFISLNLTLKSANLLNVCMKKIMQKYNMIVVRACAKLNGMRALKMKIFVTKQIQK
jgi:hypothetical protein